MPFGFGDGLSGEQVQRCSHLNRITERFWLDDRIQPFTLPLPGHNEVLGRGDEEVFFKGNRGKTLEYMQWKGLGIRCEELCRIKCGYTIQIKVMQECRTALQNKLKKTSFLLFFFFFQNFLRMSEKFMLSEIFFEYTKKCWMSSWEMTAVKYMNDREIGISARWSKDKKKKKKEQKMSHKKVIITLPPKTSQLKIKKCCWGSSVAHMGEKGWTSVVLN